MSLLDLLKNQMAGEATSQMSQQLGLGKAETEKAVGAALPTLLAALAGNAMKKEGASALSNALDRDHDGSILDDVVGFLGGGDKKPGDGILKHVLGGKRGAVEAEVARETNLSPSAVSSLLPMLAPLIMGALGREKRKSGLDVAGLAGLLSKEGQEAKKAAPSGLSMLGAFLDQDGDGIGADDIADAGKGILGKLF